MRPADRPILKLHSGISIHAPLAGCDESFPLLLHSPNLFQSTHPLRGATFTAVTTSLSSRFQSTHPLRGATKVEGSSHSSISYFNPRTPCGVRRPSYRRADSRQDISIHAPLAGCDVERSYTGRYKGISIHAPLAGCDPPAAIIIYHKEIFQSTHPLRGATRLIDRGVLAGTFQSTHPLRGATKQSFPQGNHLQISIHAPLAGCDCRGGKRSRRRWNFNPRTPCGVRPPSSRILRQTQRDFNPRTPCGVRQAIARKARGGRLFQSTHPLRGATERECDDEQRYFYFNPRTPCGVRRFHTAQNARTFLFQSTHPLRGATSRGRTILPRFGISIHAPLAGCDLRRSALARNPAKFQSTHPLRGATSGRADRPRRQVYFNPRTPCGVRP